MYRFLKLIIFYYKMEGKASSEQEVCEHADCEDVRFECVAILTELFRCEEECSDMIVLIGNDLLMCIVGEFNGLALDENITYFNVTKRDIEFV